MNIAKTEFGACFPDNPYFPAFLGNGTDGMLINILGSGDCYWQEFDYSAPLTSLRSKGWFKSDRRVKGNTELVYGTLLPIVEFSSSPLLHGDYMVPRECSQYFSPKEAVLTTLYSQADCTTGETVSVRATTFLTSAHVLVEHYEVLSAPKDGVEFAFVINSPTPLFLDVYKPVNSAENTMVTLADGGSICYQYNAGGYEGRAVSWLDGSWTLEKLRNDCHVSLAKMRSEKVCAGDSITRYLAVVDNVDAPDYVSVLEDTKSAYRRLGYERVLADHRREWREYFGSCEVRLPDPALQYAYNVSRYVMKATHHPSGFQPVGILPYLFQGVMFWDAYFMMLGMLGCGNLKEPSEILGHLHHLIPHARQLAKDFDADGARIEWTVETDGFTTYPSPCMQVHNNAVWAHAIYEYYEYTSDISVLAERFPLMEELLAFMTSKFLLREGDTVIIRNCEGVDEHVSNDTANDTWTCAVTLKALQDYRKALLLLDRQSGIEDLDNLISGLELGLATNIDADGVMQSFRGGKLPHWGSLIYHLFPEHETLDATMGKMFGYYDPKRNLYNFHGVNRYAEKSFPWAQYWAIRIFATAGNPIAVPLLKNGIENTSTFAGIPERIFYHGEHFNNWFSTAHGALVWAVNGMLAYAYEEKLSILPAGHWADVEFDGVYAGEGLVVSASIEHGELRSLSIENLQNVERDIEYSIADGRSQRVHLLPGMTCIEPFALATQGV